MTEPQTEIMTAGAMRAAFQVEQSAEHRTRRSKGIETARAMVVSMSAQGVDSVDDFMFAATFGRPYEHKTTTELLESAAQLKPGQVVGLLSHDRSYRQVIEYVGHTGPVPFGMEVQSGHRFEDDGPQHNRQLRAVINLDLAVERVAGTTPGGSIEPLVNPTTVDLVYTSGEPSWPHRDGPLFFNRALLVGASAIARHAIEQGEDKSLQMLDEYADRAARGNLANSLRSSY